MPKLPVMSGHDIARILARAGFDIRRQKGSHLILVKEMQGSKRAVVVPNHGEIDRGTLVEIIRQAGLKREEFLKLASEK